MSTEAPSPQSPLGEAMRLLAARQYEAAWPLYDARRRFMVPPLPTPITEDPEWLGDDPRGKRLMVVAEQGWGDQLMFGRYLPRLRQAGAHVTVACHPQLARIFSVAADAVTPFYLDRPLPPADGWVYIGSLPLRLGPAQPPPPAYFSIPAPRSSGVGVVTRGSATHANDAHRSLPADAAARLLACGRNLLPDATGAGDFLETAALLASLSLVITVDTAIAHLAGAMGKPTWVLLPHQGLDWRWNDAIRSDWYPQARLFRQPEPGDWASVIRDVERALADAP